MSDENKDLAIIQPASGIVDYQQARSVTLEFYKKQMKKDRDYGIIPGTKKPSLWQPGAEKLANLFGLVPTFTLVKEVEDFENTFFYYKYRCELHHFKTGRKIGDAERSCNSKEKKYIYQKPNEILNSINTLQAMAQKRALVAAVRTATMATEIFSEEDGATDRTPPRSADPDVEATRIWKIALAKLFASGAERGFDVEQLKGICYKKYNVDSMTKLTLQQLEERYEALITKWQVVGKGNHPLPLNNAKPAAQAIDGEVIDDIPFDEPSKETVDVEELPI